MKLALVSMDQKWLDKRQNKIIAKKIIIYCKSKNVDLIIFPEMTLTGFCINNDSIAESRNDSESIRFFDKLSKKYKISIIFGAPLLDEKKHLNNDLIYVNPSDSDFQDYSKIHPFSFSGENLFYKSGDKIVFLNHDGIKLGASICYDLRFPILFNLMADKCHGIVCIANWPSVRIDHWFTLLKARAIENQLFMIGVNRDGIDGNAIKYQKSSVIFSPDGERLKPLEKFNEIEIYDICFENVAKIRNNFKTYIDNTLKNYINLDNKFWISNFDYDK